MIYNFQGTVPQKIPSPRTHITNHKQNPHNDENRNSPLENAQTIQILQRVASLETQFGSLQHENKMLKQKYQSILEKQEINKHNNELIQQLQISQKLILKDVSQIRKLLLNEQSPYFSTKNEDINQTKKQMGPWQQNYLTEKPLLKRAYSNSGCQNSSRQKLKLEEQMVDLKLQIRDCIQLACGQSTVMTGENSEQTTKPQNELQDFLHSSVKKTDEKPINRAINYPSVSFSLKSDDYTNDQIQKTLEKAIHAIQKEGLVSSHYDKKIQPCQKKLTGIKKKSILEDELSDSDYENMISLTKDIKKHITEPSAFTGSPLVLKKRTSPPNRNETFKKEIT